MFFVAIHGGYTAWSVWGTCSKECGGGIKRRTRNCTSPEPKNGGLNCTRQGLGAAYDEVSCKVGCCPGKF